jgi:GDPmannose 4,6-dehydratase
VQQLCEIAFQHAGLDYKDYVKLDARFIRPAEVDLLVADPSRAREKLGWEPQVRFHQLVTMMVDADLARHRAGPGTG